MDERESERLEEFLRQQGLKAGMVYHLKDDVPADIRVVVWIRHNGKPDEFITFS